MRRLFLLRHAKSCWDDQSLDDFDRPLSRRGRRNAVAMGRHMERERLRPDIILCSTARRTAETLELVHGVLEGVPVSLEPDLYEAGRGDLVGRLRQLDDYLASVLLIGHNPGLERLALSLTGGHGDGEAMARLDEKFPTGSLAVLESDIGHWRELQDGTCRLASFMRPEDVED